MAYNLNGAELYYSSGSQWVFLRKDAPFEFWMSDAIDSVIRADTEKTVRFMAVNASYRIFFGVPKGIFNKHDYFGISFLEDKKWGLRLHLDLDGFGTVLRGVVVEPNKAWRSKYYPKPNWEQ